MNKQLPPTQINDWQDVCSILQHFEVPYTWVQEQTDNPDKWVVHLSKQGWDLNTALKLLTAYTFLRKIDSRQFLWVEAKSPSNANNRGLKP